MVPCVGNTLSHAHLSAFVRLHPPTPPPTTHQLSPPPCKTSPAASSVEREETRRLTERRQPRGDALGGRPLLQPRALACHICARTQRRVGRVVERDDLLTQLRREAAHRLSRRAERLRHASFLRGGPYAAPELPAASLLRVHRAEDLPAGLAQHRAAPPFEKGQVVAQSDAQEDTQHR
eukprot:scaffold104058_cov62-Phaeocystis_antarctica.AAC.3